MWQDNLFTAMYFNTYDSAADESNETLGSTQPAAKQRKSHKTR